MNKLVILDRDGVINEDSDNYIKSVAEWHPIPGSIEAIGRLSKAGFTIAIATNQSGLARGYFSLETLEAMHQKMISLVEKQGGSISTIAFCPHHPDDNCDCRKPLPGLVDQIEQILNVSAEGAIFVGDTKKDMQVAISKNCTPILVKTGKGQRTLDKGLGLENVTIFDDLSTAVDSILA
ncbi:MAG: D-glycero-beta-D-manno-heptose 1,7-bisphosphate 7-phosphatase [Motiliproteus sp.]|nr:D-glycero-beta-D-manno-heptose 1,7-bisphosphate 7-phosphatase [Motiliproteus sp.]MCW9052436.1 D-glycero-beta-D-manno-heptose 1,7-bisphosphate 7-phosphatase [Motiliproteus sp.]